MQMVRSNLFAAIQATGMGFGQFTPYNCPGGMSRRHAVLQSSQRESVIAKNRNQNTFAKRQREQDKKRKAEDKLARRVRKKDSPDAPPDERRFEG